MCRSVYRISSNPDACFCQNRDIVWMTSKSIFVYGKFRYRNRWLSPFLSSYSLLFQVDQLLKSLYQTKKIPFTILTQYHCERTVSHSIIVLVPSFPFDSSRTQLNFTCSFQSSKIHQWIMPNPVYLLPLSLNMLVQLSYTSFHLPKAFSFISPKLGNVMMSTLFRKGRY